MGKIKYALYILIFLSTISSVEAFSIDYGSILSAKDNNILIQYYGIDKKSRFICNVSTRTCSSTKKTTLGNTNSKSIPAPLKLELDEKGARRITFSPNNKFVSYSIRPTAEDKNRVFVIKDLNTNEDYKISSSVLYWDLTNEQSKILEFSPDNKTLVHLDDRGGALALYHVNLDSLANGTFTSNKLQTSAYTIVDFVFTDKQTIYYIGNSKDNPYVWSLYRYNLKTDTDTLIESNVSYVDKLRKIGASLVFNRLQKNGYGPVVYNTSSKKIFQFKVPKVDTNKKVIKDKIVKISNMTGVLMAPEKISATKKYPLIIWLHGGPLRQTSYGYHPYHSYGIYDGMLELLRKNGVIVLKLDYRGSFGFDRAYAEGIKGNVGKGDVTDVMDALSYMHKYYNIDKTYLAGNSYGGYMSLRTLVDHPESFDGVISINGVTDWESLIVKMQTSIFNTQFDGLPNESNRALYDQASIANRTHKIGNQKIKIIAGEADRTIPVWQAMTLYEKLKAENKNVSLVTYPGEDHVFKGKKAISDICRELFRFVELAPDKNCKS